MDVYAELARLTEEGRAFILATVIDSAGSTPQKPGTKMIVLRDGAIRGTVGGGAIEKQVIDAALALFDAKESSRLLETHLTHELGMCCGGKMKIFLEKHAAVAELFVFGAGHVGRELAVLAHRVRFRVTVVDDRPEWTRRERFGEGIRVETADPARIALALPGGVNVYFCVTTHDHPLDQAVLEALLRKPAAYHGVIGSVRKAERFKLRLRASGFTDEELAKMRSPMGLPIAALTPEEIAVSIVAELIQIRRRDTPRR